ncbi:MAG: TonB family protein [Burkholderiales bacterium]|nr:TonB family protein [Burkholderiales bacterium]
MRKIDRQIFARRRTARVCVVGLGALLHAGVVLPQLPLPSTAEGSPAGAPVPATPTEPALPPSALPQPSTAPPADMEPAELPVQELQFWRQRIRDAIQQHMSVPQSIPLDAHVELEVSLLSNGLAGDITTRRASGFPDLDAALRRAVLEATPLPLPSQPQAYARLRRFSVLYEVRSGVRVVDAPAPSPQTPRSESFACRAPDAAKAPDCASGGSRADLLTCFAQAVRARTLGVAAACGADVYPLEARRNAWEGTVQIEIGFESAGRLSVVSVAESSGHEVLDQRAVDLVRESIVPPPPELLASAFMVQVPVVFRMQEAQPDAAPAATPPAAAPKPSAKPKGGKAKKPAKKPKKSTARKRRV